MNYISFIEKAEKKLELIMPFLSKEMIQIRARDEWEKHQFKQKSKRDENNKNSKVTTTKNTRYMSSFREKLHSLTSDFVPCEMENSPTVSSHSHLKLKYNLRPKVNTKTNIYDFPDDDNDEEHDTIQPVQVTSHKKPVKATNQHKTKKETNKSKPKIQTKNLVRFEDKVVKDKEFVPIKTVTEIIPKIVPTKKKREKEISPTQIDEVIYETQFMTDENEAGNRINLSNNPSNDKQLESVNVGKEISNKNMRDNVMSNKEEENRKNTSLIIGGNGVVNFTEDNADEEISFSPLTLAIEKLTEKINIRNTSSIDSSGRNGNIYWQITISNQAPHLMPMNKIEKSANLIPKECISFQSWNDDVLESGLHNDFSNILVDKKKNVILNSPVVENLINNAVPSFEDENIETDNDKENLSVLESNENSKQFPDVYRDKMKPKDERLLMEDPFKDIGNKLEKLDTLSRKIQAKMERFWRKTENTFREIDEWQKEMNVAIEDSNSVPKLTRKNRNKRNIKHKIKVIERKDKKTINDTSFCSLFDDPSMDNRVLFGQSDEYISENSIDDSLFG